MQPAHSGSFPPTGTAEAEELQRVWNKWTSFPVPPQSEQACLQSTDPIYQTAATIVASRQQYDPARNSQLGDALGEVLGFLTRACYMLGLDLTTSRRAHPFTASSLSAEVSYAVPIIKEACRPAGHLLAGLIAEAEAMEGITVDTRNSIAAEAGRHIQQAATACYVIGSLDASKQPLPAADKLIPSLDTLRARWAGYTLSGQAQTDFLEVTLNIEGAIDDLLHMMSFHWPIATAPLISFEFREKAASLVKETMNLALYLGLHAAEIYDRPPNRLSEPIIAALILISSPLLELISGIPHTADKPHSSQQRSLEAASDIAGLTIAGACQIYFTGLQAPARS